MSCTLLVRLWTCYLAIVIPTGATTLRDSCVVLVTGPQRCTKSKQTGYLPERYLLCFMLCGFSFDRVSFVHETIGTPSFSILSLLLKRIIQILEESTKRGAREQVATRSYSLHSRVPTVSESDCAEL